MNFILGATDIVDKLAESGIVVLIGVSTVFLLLFLLIGVVKLLQYVEKLLKIWDAKMAVVRANKAEVKAVKQSYIDDRDEEINAIYTKNEKGEMTAKEAKQAIAEIKADFKQNKKPLMDKEVSELKAKQKGQLTTEESAPVVVANDGEVVTDERLIAVITAAIAVVTEQECAERKVKFKVRTIKHIK